MDLSMEGLSPKLRSLFDPLMVFDHGTLVPLECFGIWTRLMRTLRSQVCFFVFVFVLHLLYVHLSLIMVRSFEEHLYSNCRIRCTHSRVIVLYVSLSPYASLPSLPISTHSPSFNPSHFLTLPSLPSHIHPLTLPQYALPVQLLYCCLSDNMERLVPLDKE